jgi:hypothetical protein
MRPHGERLLIVGLALLALPVLHARSLAEERLGVALMHGQWVAGDCGSKEFRRASGVEAAGEWLSEHLRITGGLRMAREAVEARSGDEASVRGTGDLRLQTGLLGAYRHRYFEVGLGIGFFRYTDIGSVPEWAVLPAATLRLGPEWLYLSATLLDFSTEARGLGVLRSGLGGKLGPVDLWAGLGVDAHIGGPAFGLAYASSESVKLTLDGLVGGEVEGHAEYAAKLGLAFTLGP